MDDSSVSINSLPDELLSTIFDQAIEPDKDVYPLECPDYTTFSSLSCVCTRWRQVILDNGPLWASAINVDNDTIAWAQEILRRAKDSPLVVYSQGPYRAPPSDDDNEKKQAIQCQNFVSETWRYIWQNIHRWGVFKLGADIINHSAETISRGLIQPAPELQTFMLRNEHKFELRNANLDLSVVNIIWLREQYILPEKLFGGDAPQLKEFDIANVYLPASFDFSLWGNLTTLSVEQGMDACLDEKVFTKNWFNILRPLIQLETLKLNGTFSGTFNQTDVGLSESTFSQIPEIHLDCLFHLSLSTGSKRDIMFALFAKLVVPHTCKIHLSVQYSKYSYSLDDFGPYPPLAFDRLKIGLDRYARGLFADLDDAADSGLLNLWNSVDGVSFGFELGRDPGPDNPSYFRFSQVREGEDESKLEKPLFRPEGDNLDSITPSGYSHYPFSQMLAVLEDLPIHALRIGNLPRIVAEDIDPLYRLFSRCENIMKLRFLRTDSIVFDILLRKNNYILLKLVETSHECYCLQDMQRLKRFTSWFARKMGLQEIDSTGDVFMATTEAMMLH